MLYTVMRIFALKMFYLQGVLMGKRLMNLQGTEDVKRHFFAVQHKQDFFTEFIYFVLWNFDHHCLCVNG